MTFQSQVGSKEGTIGPQNDDVTQVSGNLHDKHKEGATILVSDKRCEMVLNHQTRQ
jgi:hypothetical protein